MYQQITLPNGARILTEAVPGARSAALGFFVGVGSRHERRQDNGAAHFIEHMLFKGTDRRSAAQLARDIFGVPKVISRVSDPRREEVFSSFGLSTICPTNLTVASVVAALDDRRKHTEEVYFGSTRISFEQMEIDRRYLGEFAEAIELPKGTALIGVLSQSGKLRLRGEGMQTVIGEGDVLVLARSIG